MSSKANATIYFASGKTLGVIETCSAILSSVAWTNPSSPPGPLLVTQINGAVTWVNLRSVERIEPA